ncbi:MAG: hypothetical protein Q7T79_02920 [bacterium]|nr:hypothetical protein [bacterium]
MADDKKILTKIENLLGRESLLNKKKSGKVEGVVEKREVVSEITSEKESAEISSSELAENISSASFGDLSSSATSKLRQRQKQVEKVLESGLKEIYDQLPDDKKREFKIVGEQTAIKINLLLEKTKVKIKDIIDLIKKWLLLIPGINKYFLEQEAKIKADEIIKIK